jgi:hypothetical protein
MENSCWASYYTVYACTLYACSMVQEMYYHCLLMLLLPPTLFCCSLQSRVVRYIGPACLPDLCEADCPGGHHFFKAKVLPTEAQLSSGAGPVAAAAGGRPVELQVDLAAHHRVHSWAQLLQLDEQALQVRDMIMVILKGWQHDGRMHMACALVQTDTTPCKCAWRRDCSRASTTALPAHHGLQALDT